MTSIILTTVLQAIRITFLVAVFVGSWIGMFWLTTLASGWNPTISGFAATAAACLNAWQWWLNTSTDDDDEDNDE
jgi:hypothetical protein